jgi:hypothetical protein
MSGLVPVHTKSNGSGDDNLNRMGLLIASPMAPCPDFPFPVELLTEIVKLLPTPDQRTLSLTSHVTRIYTIPFAFGNLQYTGKVAPKIRNIHQASQGVKDVIRFVKIVSVLPFSTDISETKVPTEKSC